MLPYCVVMVELFLSVYLSNCVYCYRRCFRDVRGPLQNSRIKTEIVLVKNIDTEFST